MWCHSGPNPLPVRGGIAPMSCFATAAAVAEEEEAVAEEEGKAASEVVVVKWIDETTLVGNIVFSDQVCSSV